MSTTLRRIPTEIALLIATYAAPPDGSGRVLDASCYEGDALRALGQAWKCETFGAEPTGAATMAAYGTTKIVRDAFVNVRVTDESMSAAVGILPSEGASAGAGDPADVLGKLTDALLPGGLLAVLAERSAFTRGLCISLVRHFDELRVGLMSRVLFGDLVLLIGVKRNAQATGTHSSQLQRLIVSDDLPALGPADEPLVQLPVASGEFLFGPQTVDYGAAAIAARTHGVWVDPASASVLFQPVDRGIRPTIPPRRGHIAHIIAGGLFDNLILRRDGTVIVLKGRTPKERARLAEDDPPRPVTPGATPQPVQRVRFVERFRTVVTALDLATGELYTPRDL